MDVTASFVETAGFSSLAGRYVVAFAWLADGFLLANIEGRGWCTPSGHVEQGETPVEAAIREVREEVGAGFSNPIELGRFELTASNGEKEDVPTYLGDVIRVDSLPHSNEVAAVQRFKLEEIPANYYHWDPLLERVFQRAYRIAKLLFPADQTPTADSLTR